MEPAKTVFAGGIEIEILGIYLLINDKDPNGFWAVFTPAIFHAGNYVYHKRREIKVPEKEKKRK
ncbi:hypothetical protein KKB06_00260 [Patescibacteria group bacterium]|nr:hypothetical protein [Patescibacteria group bacterium]